MKQIVLKFLLTFSLCMPLFANMDARIKAIQNAPIEERFKLMNAFKKEIILMQEQERIEAITKLKSITQSKYSTHALKELKSHIKSKQGDPLYNTNKIKIHIDMETEEHIEDEAGGELEDETHEALSSEIEDEFETQSNPK